MVDWIIRLLDEVQDTSPGQWDIAGQLTSEFFAGEGAQSNRPRSVFAVGDRKQSIYGFQGADPEAFEVWRGKLGVYTWLVLGFLA